MEEGKTQHETRLIVSAVVGLHARPAAALVKLAQGFDADIEITLNGRTVNAKSIMGVITLGAEHGVEVNVSAVGQDAEEAIGAITQLFESNFGEPNKQPVPPKKSGSPNDTLVLVADDEPTIRGMVTTILNGCGYQTVVANNGLEAVDLFAKRPHEIKVAVVDMIMPVMSGEVAIREMRRLKATLPVILMSGSMENSPLPRDAITAFLRKPFRVAEFLPILRTLLDASAPGSGTRQPGA